MGIFVQQLYTAKTLENVMQLNIMPYWKSYCQCFCQVELCQKNYVSSKDNE